MITTLLPVLQDAAFFHNMHCQGLEKCWEYFEIVLKRFSTFFWFYFGKIANIFTCIENDLKYITHTHC